MAKNTFQDIVKVKSNKKSELNQKKIFNSDISQKENKSYDPNDGKQKDKTSYSMLWFIALISIVFLFFAMSFLFSTATVTINPKTKDFNVDKTLTATKNTSDALGLTYDLVVLSGEEQKEVIGSEEKNWEVNATGHVLVYNSFSFLSQTLAQNTKLEGSNGKIYKTKNKVIIPGMSKKNIPGKIDVDIYGEKIGEEYNSMPLDFKIVSYKGTTKYSKIFAMSVGNITGGLNGKSSQLSDNDKNNTVEELKNILSKKLLEKIKNQIPKDFILLKNATFLNIDEEKVTPAETKGTFIVSIKGTFSGILFDKNKLTKEVISEIFPATDNSVGTLDNLSAITSDNTNVTDNDIYISNIENLAISSFDQNLVSREDMKDISFNLLGTVKVVWKVDGNKITEDLLGRNKKGFNQILRQYSNIDSADMVIKPVWRNSFPDKINKIKVNINYPK